MRPARRRARRQGLLCAVAALGLGALGACAENVVTQPDMSGQPPVGADLSGGGGVDGPVGSTGYVAIADDAPVLRAQAGLPSADRWRERKRDGAVTLLGAGRALYVFAGAAQAGPPWILGQLIQDPASIDDLARGAGKISVAGVAPWAAGDVYAPFLSQDLGVRGAKVTLYFAASGSPDIAAPDNSYVTQIGVATSADGQSFTVEPRQAVTVSWLGQAPAMAGPDSHGATDPTVIKFNGQFQLFYAGLACDNNGCRYRVLQRTSADGLSFGAAKVVIDRPRDVGGDAGPSAVVLDNRILLAYTAVKRQASKTRDAVYQALTSGAIYLAESSDGTTFNDLKGPLLDSNVNYPTGVGRAYLYNDSGTLRMLFNGTNDTGATQVYRATLSPR